MRMRQCVVGVAVSLLAVAGGCATKEAAVPMSATLMTSGNTRATFRPTEYGRVYVSDRTDQKILYQADVNNGELVEVNAETDRVMVDGRIVSDRTLDNNHEFQIFFEPLNKERTVQHRVVEERTTTTTEQPQQPRP